MKPSQSLHVPVLIATMMLCGVFTAGCEVTY
jgi:hypothetical protein